MDLKLFILYRCFLCTREENLTVIPYSLIIKFFIERNVIILHGTKSCSKHMNFTNEMLEKNQPKFEDCYMTGSEISRFLEKLRDEVLKEKNQNQSGKTYF